MKTTPYAKLCASLLTLLAAGSLHAAVNITTTPTPDPFPAPPWPTTLGDATATGVTSSWTTLKVGTASALQTGTELDTKVIRDTAATAVITALGSSATIPPSTNAVARYNTGTANGNNAFLQTNPTGSDYVLLMARLANATGGPLNSVQVQYKYSKGSTGDSSGENVKGLRAYFSLTGATGSWQMIPALSVDTTGTLAAPQAISATLALPSTLAANGTMFLLWADQNSTVNPDASYHIDDFAVSTGGAPGCSIIASAGAVTRNPGTDPSNPADDTLSFSTTVIGSGPLSPSGWNIAAPAGFVGFTSGPYGSAHPFTDAPVVSLSGGAGRYNFTVQDVDATSACQATVAVTAPTVIGTNEVASPSLPIMTDVAAPAFWVFDENLRRSTQNSATQADHVVTSATITLPGGTPVQFSADLDAITGTSSGFELPDGFGLELIIDGAAPISVLGAADVDSNGRLNGADAAGGAELPDTTLVSTTKSFSFSQIIPASAATVQIRFIGNSNSANETFVVKNLKLSIPGNGIVVSGGASVLQNQGTTNTADDTFTALLDVTAVGFAGTSWESDEVPVRSGAYSPPSVTFGPYLISGGAKTVTIHDFDAPATVSPAHTIPLPPAATLAATPAANITIQPNGTLTFTSTVTGSNGGPSWNVSGATASTNTYGGSVTFTIPAPLPVGNASVILTDASYPSATQTLVVAVPVVYVIGQTNFGGLQDLRTVASDALWVNNAGSRTLTMTAGVVADSIVTSSIIDLTAIGQVNFTGKFNIAEVSAGSNLEIGDKFKAELIIDGGLPSQQIVNLVSLWDIGDGTNSTTAATNGRNGPPNGYINGYNGTVGTDLITNTPYTVAADEYNANRSRDEFNLKNETVAVSITNDFPLAYTIPASANSVQLKIYGAGFSGTETATVSDILFTGASTSNDNDGDGVSNGDEAIMGTDPNNPTSVLRLTQNPANRNQFQFPGKSGRFYRVYVSNDLNKPSHLMSWKDTGLATIVGANATASFNITVSGTAVRRFYRLHVMQSDGPWPPTRP